MADDLAALRRKIDAFPATLTARLRAIAWRKSRDVQARARQILDQTTHGTGQTARSIVVLEEADAKQFLVTVDNPDNPNLALWLERGTVKMTARPFLRPAGDAITESYRREMIAAATAAAEELGR